MRELSCPYDPGTQLPLRFGAKTAFQRPLSHDNELPIQIRVMSRQCVDQTLHSLQRNELAYHDESVGWRRQATFGQFIDLRRQEVGKGKKVAGRDSNRLKPVI